MYSILHKQNRHLDYSTIYITLHNGNKTDILNVVQSTMHYTKKTKQSTSHEGNKTVLLTKEQST